jgi:hypothetical protein
LSSLFANNNKYQGRYLNVNKKMSVETVKENNNLDQFGRAINKGVSMDGKHTSGKSSELSPERVMEIVKRINDNFYDREDIMKIVAEKILKSPELQTLLKSKIE